MDNLQLFPTPTQTAKKQSAQSSRASRYDDRLWLRTNSANDRIKHCGQGTVDGTVRVQLGRAGGRRVAGACGLITCGSIWQCPVCASKIATKRQNDITNAFFAIRDTGAQTLFVTFTMRHNASQPLADVWSGLTDSWNGMTSGGGWALLKKQFGIIGHIRATEVTHGANGWHVHAHAALVLDGTQQLAESELTLLGDLLFVRWESSLERNGFSAVREHAVDIRRTYSDSGLARYMNKQASSAAAELSQGHNKKAGKGSRTAFAILSDLRRSGQTKCLCKGATRVNNRCDLCLWREWEKSSSGRRQLTWSKNLNAFVKLSADEDEADTDLTMEEKTHILDIFSSDWRNMDDKHLVPSFYSLLENEGIIAACDFLTKHGIFWQFPTHHNIPQHYFGKETPNER